MTPLELKKRIGATWQEIATQCGLRSAVNVWRWKIIPAKHLLAIEARWDVPREEMRPDLYGPNPYKQEKNDE